MSVPRYCTTRGTQRLQICTSSGICENIVGLQKKTKERKNKMPFYQERKMRRIVAGLTLQDCSD